MILKMLRMIWMTKYLEFVCPECGLSTLTEVYENCITEHEISMREDGEIEYYDSQSYDGTFVGFECTCGYRVPIDVKAMPYDEAKAALRLWLISREPNIDKVLESL